MPRSTKPQISFADWELLQQGIVLEPLLQNISDFLDDHEELIEPVRRDLQRGLKNPRTGRGGLTPQQVLRSLIVMRVKSWDYRELRERIADGYTLRQFTDFYCQPVPKHDAFNRAFNRLTPKTLQAVNELVVQAAVDLGLEDGRTLRVDSTVVQTDIHHPTDSTLLWDVVRVITRLIGCLAQAVQQHIQGFRNRTRAARRRMQEIQRMTPKERHAERARPVLLRNGVGLCRAWLLEPSPSRREPDLSAELRFPLASDLCTACAQAAIPAIDRSNAGERGIFQQAVIGKSPGSQRDRKTGRDPCVS